MKTKLASFKLKLVTACLLLIFISCQKKQIYYYSEQGRNKMTIEAYTDSAAYMKAFLNLQITLKLYEDDLAANGKKWRHKPVSFTLLNSKKEDITKTVQFANKETLEAEVTRRVKRLENYFQKEMDERREIK